MLYIAIGILGATVMPHNLYLHSSIVQTRKYKDDLVSRREAVGFSVLDSTVALMFALFLNGVGWNMAFVAGSALLTDALAPNERRGRIEVGYGLEDRLTDAQSSVIIHQVITPSFKAGNFSKGISDGVLESHFKLYEGYVNKRNEILEKLGDLDLAYETDGAGEPLLLLMGIGPLVAWRRSSLRALQARNSLFLKVFLAKKDVRTG